MVKHNFEFQYRIILNGVQFNRLTFVSYVNQYRISRACYILKNCGKTVVECAYDSGYTSLRRFNRNFKLYVGVSPRNFRSAK